MLGQNFWFIQIKYKKKQNNKKKSVQCCWFQTRCNCYWFEYKRVWFHFPRIAYYCIYLCVFLSWLIFFFFSFSFFSLSSYYLLLYFIFTFYCFLFLIVFPLSITFFLFFWPFYFSFRSLSSSPLSPFLPPPLSLFSLYFLSINTILDNGNDNSHVVIVMYICNLLSS